jgi:hypothetical protein
VNIVDAHHGIAPLKKTFGQVEAYSPCGIMLCIIICDFIPQGEASGAGYKDFHKRNRICLKLLMYWTLRQAQYIALTFGFDFDFAQPPALISPFSFNL